MSRRPHRRFATLVTLMAATGLAGCPAPTAPAGPAPGAAEVGAGSRAFVFDVDPVRASAFERPGELPSDSLSLLVSAPEVVHDAATGQTTVRLAVTNAGAPLSDLQLAVSGDRPALRQQVDASLVQSSGGTRPVELVFDNPGGDSFSVRLDFQARRLSLTGQPPVRQVLATGVAGVTASSAYGSLVPERVVDGDYGTQWASGGYREAEAWLALDTGSVRSLSSLSVKMQPQSGGAYYRLEVSSDGVNYAPVTGQLKNSSWGAESKALPAGTQGRYLRLHFFNDASSPETRFSVFEAVVDGGSGASPAPTPTAAPSGSPSPAPTPTPAPPGALSATASSTYPGLLPANAVDGDLNTQWANGGYREPEAWLTLDTGSVRSLSGFSSKMRPATFRLEVSSDGTSFTPVTGQLRNTGWGTETHALPAGTQGRYMRVHFYNDASSPLDRFSVFEASVGGGATGPTPSPTPSATPSPSPSPTTTPAPNGAYGNTFEQHALGADPADFIDPLDEGHTYSWMPRVIWRVGSHDGSKQYMHDGLSNQANLSFRRYRGEALGTSNGRLPDRYFAELDVTPIRSYTYSPTGDQGTQFYYMDPTHYLELLIKPNMFEVWVANGAEPFQSRGWQRLYYTSANTSAGQRRRLAADVDATRGTIKVYLDGQHMTTLSHEMLSPQAHYFALRGTGNIVAHDNLRIEPR